MKLTVATKIIGGFTILSLLLLLTSGISLNNLSSINDSITIQNKLAVPTLQRSNQLANDLMENG